MMTERTTATDTEYVHLIRGNKQMKSNLLLKLCISN